MNGTNWYKLRNTSITVNLTDVAVGGTDGIVLLFRQQQWKQRNYLWPSKSQVLSQEDDDKFRRFVGLIGRCIIEPSDRSGSKMPDMPLAVYVPGKATEPSRRVDDHYTLPRLKTFTTNAYLTKNTFAKKYATSEIFIHSQLDTKHIHARLYIKGPVCVEITESQVLFTRKYLKTIFESQQHIIIICQMYVLNSTTWLLKLIISKRICYQVLQ